MHYTLWDVWNPPHGNSADISHESFWGVAGMCQNWFCDTLLHESCVWLLGFGVWSTLRLLVTCQQYFSCVCFSPIASGGGPSGQVSRMLTACGLRGVDMMCQDWLIQLWRKNAGTDGCSLGVTKTSGFTCQASKQGNAPRTPPPKTPGHPPQFHDGSLYAPALYCDHIITITL